MYMTVLTTLTVKVPLLVLVFIVSGCGTVTGVMGDVSSLSSKKNVKSEKSSKYTTASDLDKENGKTKKPMSSENANYSPNMGGMSPQPQYHQPVYQQQPMMTYSVAPQMAAPMYGYPMAYAQPQQQYYAPQQQQQPYYAQPMMQAHPRPSYGGFGDGRYYSR